MGESEASVHRRLEEAWGGVNWGGYPEQAWSNGTHDVAE